MTLWTLEALRGHACRHLISKMGHHLSGQAFPFVPVEDWVEQDHFGARIGHRAQSPYTCFRRTRDRDGTQSSYPEVPILFIQGGSDALLSTTGVIVHSNVDAFGDSERGSIPLLLAERLAHDLHLLDELCSSLRPGAEEAVGVAHCATQRVRMSGAKPDRRMRFLERLLLHRRIF